MLYLQKETAQKEGMPTYWLLVSKIVFQLGYTVFNIDIMDLKERMMRQNRNNSGILNSSDYNFEKDKGEQNYLIRNMVEQNIYNKSRNQCNDELTKRKNELLEHKKLVDFQRKKANDDMIKKFQSDYDEITKQIIKNVENSLHQNKLRIINEIKQRRVGQSNQQRSIKADIDEMLAKINNHLDGLKRDEHYRDHIAKVVTTDFDTKREDIKQSIKKLRYPPIVTSIDQKFYNCFRSDISKVVVVDANAKGNAYGGHLNKDAVSRFGVEDVNPHSNRDYLKKMGN